MEESVKHYNWHSTVESDGSGPYGRIAVVITEDDHFVLEQLTGAAPQTEVLAAVAELDEFKAKLYTRGEALSKGRRYRFAIQERIDLSGSSDVLLRIERMAKDLL